MAKQQKDIAASALARVKSDSRKASFSLQNAVWFPQGFTKKHDVPDKWKKSASFLTCDVIACEALSRIEEVSKKHSREHGSYELFKEEIIAARLLGKRVATPSFFHQTRKQQLNTGSSVKLMPVTKQGATKKALIITEGFKTAHRTLMSQLNLAVKLKGSKVSIITADQQKSMENHDIVNIDRLVDVHGLVKACPLKIDRNKSGKFSKVRPLTSAVC